MTRDQLKDEVSGLIDAAVPENIELDQPEIDNITDALSGDAIQELVDGQDEEDSESDRTEEVKG